MSARTMRSVRSVRTLRARDHEKCENLILLTLLGLLMVLTLLTFLSLLSLLLLLEREKEEEYVIWTLERLRGSSKPREDGSSLSIEWRARGARSARRFSMRFESGGKMSGRCSVPCAWRAS